MNIFLYIPILDALFIYSRYGKVQSVKLIHEDTHSRYVDAVVAFTDIKVASQVYNEDQLLNGAVPLSVAFCDATGTAQSDARCPAVISNSGGSDSDRHAEGSDSDDSSQSVKSDG